MANKFKILLAVAFSAVCFSCATAPENISPAYVSELSYMKYSCQQLAEEQERLVAALATAADAQRKARSSDIAGWIFLGMPVSTLSGGNRASEIARLKGELQALHKAAILKKCNFELAEDPTVRKEKPEEKAEENESGPGY